MTKIEQKTYTKTSAEKNIKKNKNILEGKLVIKIGIQGPAGTKFTLNNGSNIEIGAYGIYELDITGLGYITDMRLISLPNDNNNDGDSSEPVARDAKVEEDKPILYVDYISYESEV